MKQFGIVLFVAVFFAAGPLFGGDLYVGAKSVDITPDRPVLLQGQFVTRIAREAETPITANIVALEERDGEKALDEAVIVSLDICSITNDFRAKLFAAVTEAIPGFDPEKKMILAATHTHTSVVTATGHYVLPPDVPEGEVMTSAETIDFLCGRIVPAVKSAREERVKAKYSYGLGNAVVAFNRRSVYENGEAVMYGNTNDPKFRKIEGMEDHDVGTVFFWDDSDKLLAMLINVSCPSQEVEGRSKINADYWHPVRESLHAKYGGDVVILGLCGAAGDMSPHIRYRGRAVDRMTKLRKFDNLHEIARKVVAAVDEVYPVVEPVKTGDCPLVHRYEIFDLPQQTIPKELYEKFKSDAAAIKKRLDAAPNEGYKDLFVRYNWTMRVVTRYEQQQADKETNPTPTYAIPTHILRLGETAFCTNPFELYTDFGVQIKARSKAMQTFIIQLSQAIDKGGYVPSAYAAQGGGYGAIPQSNHVGAPGGQIYADKTIDIINSLF